MLFKFQVFKFQVFFDCYFYQKLDCQKEVFWHITSSGNSAIVMKCCLNHLWKNYGIHKNNGGAGKSD